MCCVKLSFDLTQFQSPDINLERYRTYRSIITLILEQTVRQSLGNTSLRTSRRYSDMNVAINITLSC